MIAPRFGQAKVHQIRSLDDRLSLIAQQLDKSARDPWIRAMALEIVRGVPQHGPESEDAEIARVFWFVKNNVEYRQDPRDYDFYATGRRTWQFRAGDCDDHVVAVNSLLSNLGFLTGARVISADGISWHIYSLVGVRTKDSPTAVIALDTTQPGSFPGWEPSNEYRRHEIEVTFSGGKATTRKIR